MINKIKEKIKILIFKLFKKVLYPFFIEDLVEDNYSHIKIQTTSDTLNLIQHYIENDLKGVYMRFGDGDIFLYKNKSDGYQTNNSKISIEMKESLECHGNNVHKCLAIHSNLFGFEEGMFIGNHLNSDKLSKKLLSDTFEFFIGAKIYSPIALHFTASNNVKRANTFLKILKSKTILFVGNKEVQNNTLKLLFGNSNHIKTSSRNAYDEIDRIYNEAKMEIKKINKFGVVIVAMGCSGRPLMKRLFKDNLNVYLFDFGSLLDGFDGNNSRTWLKVSDIDYEELTLNL